MGFQEAELRAALRAVAATHPAWGWRKARWHLRAQPAWAGVSLTAKRVRRLWRAEGLTCKAKAWRKRRTALAIIPRRLFKAADVVAVLEGIIAETGIEPTYVRCDNKPEFTAGALIDWCAAAGMKTAFIDPGSPWQNGFIESFNAQFRREQLAGGY